jgi:phenylalanyl-tRNA synthetase beta chain
VEKRIPVADVLETARDAAGDLLLDLRLFDRYEGEGVPDGAHSLALSLTFQDPSRTLQADEVQQRVDAVVGALQEKHGATLRA